MDGILGGVRVDLVYVAILFVLAFSTGYIVGLLQKGIHIHHHTSESTNSVEQEYNPTTEDHLPENVRTHLEQNKGYVTY